MLELQGSEGISHMDAKVDRKVLSCKACIPESKAMCEAIAKICNSMARVPQNKMCPGRKILKSNVSAKSTSAYMVRFLDGGPIIEIWPDFRTYVRFSGFGPFGESLRPYDILSESNKLFITKSFLLL